MHQQKNVNKNNYIRKKTPTKSDRSNATCPMIGPANGTQPLHTFFLRILDQIFSPKTSKQISIVFTEHHIIDPKMKLFQTLRARVLAPRILLGIQRLMCTSPFFCGEMIFVQESSAVSSTSATFNTVFTNTSVHSIFAPLLFFKSCISFPQPTKAALPRRSRFLFLSHTFLAISSLTFLAPFLRCVFMFVQHETTTCTLAARHELVFDSLPIDVFHSQVL